MSSYSITEIEGIGPSFKKKLQKIGVRTTGKLLERAANPKGRRQLAEESGIDEGRILKWANMADLMRIRGVAEEYSELLEAAGVDTVKELKRRNAANLAEKMAEVNAKKKLVRLLPSEKRVDSWVAHAKTLDAVMTY
jgi:predicted flap endonuclease-1-like 5' DNA nuclease